MNIDEFDDAVQQELRRMLAKARQCDAPGTCIAIPNNRRRVIFEHVERDYYALSVESDMLTHLDNLMKGKPIDHNYVAQGEESESDPMFRVIFVPMSNPERYDAILFARKPNGRPDFTKLIVFVDNYKKAWITPRLARPEEALFQNLERYLTGRMGGGGRRRTRRRRHRTTKKKQMRRH